MTKQGLTDLERGKYLPDGDNEYSVVRVAKTLESGGVPGGGNFRYVWRYFETSGGSREQNVNGSVTPVNFEISFVSTTFLRRLDVVCSAVNIISTLDYGSISGGLPTGLLLAWSDGVTETQIFNAQRWIHYGHFVDDQLGQLENQENPTEDVVVASCTFEPVWKFEAGSKLITRVRDDMTILRYHRTSILALEY